VTGFITTPLPILAPKAFNNATFNEETMKNGFLKKTIFKKYHSNCLGFEAPILMVALYNALFTCFTGGLMKID
jgi:hypothetical protein